MNVIINIIVVGVSNFGNFFCKIWKDSKLIINEDKNY